MGVVICGTALIAQCAPPNIQKEANIETISLHYADLKPSHFHNEIERLQEAAPKTQHPAARALLHLRLALLFAHHRNQAPNYSLALKELETYVSLAPEGGKAEIIQDWLSLLTEIVRLETENKEMKEKMEQLKDLDIELEKRRQLVK